MAGVERGFQVKSGFGGDGHGGSDAWHEVDVVGSTLSPSGADHLWFVFPQKF